MSVNNNNSNNNNNSVVTISQTVTTDQENNKSDDVSDKKSEEMQSKRFTCKQKVSLTMLAAVEFMSFCSMSILAPFYPQEAANKGMTEAMAGFVFGFYALIIFISSPIFGKILPKLGIRFLFIGGIFMCGTCNILFGLLDFLDDYTLFTTFSFVIRGLEALGASAYSTAGYVIVVKIFPENAGAVRGLLETFVGLGMSVGPAVGGFLFALGGYGLPFYVIGSSVVILAPINILLLPTNELSDVGFETKPSSLTKLLKLPTAMATCAIIVATSMAWSFLDPTLEPHLRKFSLSPGSIGLIFLLISATYGIFSPIWGWVTDKFHIHWWLMSMGFYLTGLSLLFLGPSSFIYFIDDALWLDILSLSLIGIFVAMILMPTYQALLDIALNSGFEDNLSTQSLIAGLWSSAYSLGEVLGPVLGGMFIQHFGFKITTSIFTIFTLIFGLFTTVFYLLFIQNTTILHNETEKNCKIMNGNLQQLQQQQQQQHEEQQIDSKWLTKLDIEKLA